MKLLRGKNWVELQFDKKGRKSLYIGPLWDEEKDIEGKPQYKLISFMTRRFKSSILRDNLKKSWKFSFAGCWSSEGTKNEYINYKIRISQFKDEC